MKQYQVLFESGELEKRVKALEIILRECVLCPHQCRVDRFFSKKGKCRSGVLPVVASYHAHMGEESCLVGRNGSGTIFFTHCNLSCVFCQNYDISQLGAGKEISYDDLADMMLVLQKKGCHNINFVTPTHMVYAILRALLIAIPQGLSLPLVYNSGGYDAAETIRLLEGVFDIYMPDFKYFDDTIAARLSGTKDYSLQAMRALTEMHRQVGDLKINRHGIAERGLLVRHLVLPNGLSGSSGVMRFLASLSTHTYVNIMDQYRPEYKARDFPDIKRRPTLDEYDEAIEAARKAGLYRLDSLYKGDGLLLF